MEYRKMVLMNLFSGQQWRNRHGEHRLVDTVGEGRVGRTDRVALKHIHHHTQDCTVSWNVLYDMASSKLML